jgi:hypothetical protein
MPDFESAANTIRQELSDNISGYDIAWPNVSFTPPADTPWLRFTITEGEAANAGFGGSQNLYRHPGNVIVQVFVPANEGDGRARSIADLVAAVYRGKRLTPGIRFFDAPYVNTVGRDGDWWQVNVICPFAYDLTA